jgi:ABC-type branched-subunit amino acid transport system permease subunit
MTADRTRSLAIVVAIGLAVAAAFVLPTYLVTLLSLVFIAALLASSVDLLAGQGGLVSIGHAGIAASAAYAIAWGTTRPPFPCSWAWPCSSRSSCRRSTR